MNPPDACRHDINLGSLCLTHSGQFVLAGAAVRRCPKSSSPPAAGRRLLPRGKSRHQLGSFGVALFHSLSRNFPRKAPLRHVGLEVQLQPWLKLWPRKRSGWEITAVPRVGKLQCYNKVSRRLHPRLSNSKTQPHVLN